MKNNKLGKWIGVLGFCAILGGCFDDPGTKILLTSASVEINEATTSTGTDVAKTYNKAPGAPTVFKDSIRINLVGPQRSTPINVTFSVDPTSTAVAGIHYSGLTPGVVVIPANASFVYVRFNNIISAINPLETYSIKFKITAADVPVSVNYGAFTRLIRVTCPYNIASFVGAYNATEPGYGTYPVTSAADITDATGRTIIITNFWDTGVSIKYVLNTNGTVTIPTQTFTANLGAGAEQWTVSTGAPASKFDTCNGQIVAPYSILRVATGANFENNTHTYNKP